MRYFSLVAISLLSSCSFRAPRGIPVRVSGNVRAELRIEGHASVDKVVVPLQGAPVTEFFGIPLADARDVLFVLDVSGSMAENAPGQLVAIPPPPPDSTSAPQTPASTTADAPPPPATRAPTKMEVAQAELIETLAKLPAGTRLNIVIFSDAVDVYAPDLVVVDEQTRSDMIGFVHDMQAVGATALQPAMRMALLANASRIVLLSDGLGNIGGDGDDIMRDVREGARGGVRIDTVGIGPAQDKKLLTALATETGGLYQQF